MKRAVTDDRVTDEGGALLRAVALAPDDDLPRLVYADWVEEAGDAERAEFIRLQVELARLPADSHGRRRLQDREQELWDTHKREWVPLLAEAGLLWRSDVFRRGFPHALVFRPGEYEWVGDRLLRAYPTIRCIVFDAFTARHLPPILEAGVFERITEADFGLSGVGDFGCELLAGAPAALGCLTRLSLSGNCVTDRGLVALLSGPVLTGAVCHPRLEELDLTWNRITDRGVAGLAASPAMRRLRRLRLGCNAVGDAAAAAIAHSPVLSELECLDVSDTRVTAGGMAAVRDSPHLHRLREVVAGGRGLVRAAPPAGRTS